MEVFGHSTKSYFGEAIGAKAILEAIEERENGRKEVETVLSRTFI